MITVITATLVMSILRLAVGLTAQARIASLRHRDVFEGFPNVGRDQDLHTANLPLHLLRVDLTEVAILVLHLHIPEKFLSYEFLIWQKVSDEFSSSIAINIEFYEEGEFYSSYMVG